jgi:phage tail-like protein
MPRARIEDHFQAHNFHLLDISPSLAIPPFVFNLFASFSAITAPEISLETQEVPEGNFYFKRHVISGGSVGNITLQRGVSFYDSEFWGWISSTIKGETPKVFPPVLGGKRRNLLLIQYMGYQVGRGGVAAAGDVLTTLLSGFPGSHKIPGKAWMLLQCLPIRYKVASDFDATSHEVSIMELEISVERVEEFAIAA